MHLNEGMKSVSHMVKLENFRIKIDHQIKSIILLITYNVRLDRLLNQTVRSIKTVVWGQLLSKINYKVYFVWYSIDTKGLKIAITRIFKCLF